MNKKLLSALIAVLFITPIATNASAVEQTAPSLVIIDTALDSTLPVFQDKIAYEVCMIDWPSCSNGQTFNEGPGAASLPANLYSKNGFDHGTQMASIAVAANPNMKIVFIRIIGNTPDGRRQITSEKTIYNALNWVIANKTKFNIQAVAMAQGRHDYRTYVNYCFNTPITKNSIKTLISLGVPTFLAAGNNRDLLRIDWPSCIEESIAIGATDQYDEVASYSNYDKNLIDFYALGITSAWKPGGTISNVAGTSASTQIAAAQWIAIKQAKPNLSYQEIYDLISRTSKTTNSAKVFGGKLINIQGAING